MNIAYLTQLTNLDITNRNPLEYITDYDKPEFEALMPSHLLPEEILEWARKASMPNNALDIFIDRRVDLIIDDLKKKLSGLTVEIIDTAQTIKAQSTNSASEPNLEITEIAKRSDPKKTKNKIKKTNNEIESENFLNAVDPSQRKKVQLILDHFKTYPVVSISWSNETFLLCITSKDGKTRVPFVRVFKDRIRSGGYYKQLTNGLVTEEMANRMDEYYNQLRNIGIETQLTKDNVPMIPRQSLSNFSTDQIEKLIGAIDLASKDISLMIAANEG
jgi:hypothetical protein